MDTDPVWHVPCGDWRSGEPQPVIDPNPKSTWISFVRVLEAENVGKGSIAERHLKEQRNVQHPRQHPFS
jgi:hypothetical protein